MKLPGINYNTPVQSLGRQDISAPGRISAQETQVINQAADLGKGIYTAVQTQDGLRAFTDAQRELHDFEVELENSPATSQEDLDKKFKERMSSIRKNNSDGLDGIALSTFESKFSPKEETMRFGVNGVNASRLGKQARADMQNSLNELSKVDLQASLEQLQESPLYSDAEKSEGARALIKQNHTTQVSDAIYSGDPQQIQETIDMLRDGVTPMSDTEKRQNLGFLKTALTQANAEQVAAKEKARELFASELELGIDDGSRTPTDVYKAFDEDLITGAKRTQLIKAWRNRSTEETGAAERSTKLAYSLANDIPLDPKNKDDVLAVDEAYDEALATINDQGPLQPQVRKQVEKQLADKAINVAKRTNILPSKMEADLRIFGFTGNPEQVQKQANIYKSLRESAPNVIQDISPQTKAVYESMASMVEGGTPPDEALRVSRENAKASKEVKAQYREQYKNAGASPERLSDLLHSDGQFDLDFFGEPDPSAQQAASFQAMEYQYFIDMGGDIEMATKAATNDFKRIYHGTRLAADGVQVMAYAPEQYYQMLSEDELKSSMMTKAKESGIKKDVFIQSDSVTAREKDKSYTLWTKNEFGLPAPILTKEGNPVRWTPSIKTVTAERTKKLKQQVLDARKEREAKTKYRDDLKAQRAAAKEKAVADTKRRNYSPGL